MGSPMRRANVLITLGVGALALVSAGCNCNPAPERQLFVTFTSPIDGQQLTANDDLDSTTPGLQTNVSIQVVDQGSQPVSLESAQLDLKLTSDVNWSDVVDGTIDGNKVTWSNVTLQPHANQL